MQPKDIIDIVLKALTLCTTIAIACIGAIYTCKQNEFAQVEQTSLETNRTLQILSDISKLTQTKDEGSNTEAYDLVTTLKDETFKNKLSPTIRDDLWFKTWVQRIEDRAAGAKVTTQPLNGAPASAERWIYLGQFNGKSWDTRYLDGIDPQIPPIQLQGKVLTPSVVIGAIYERSGPATEQALMPAIGTLNLGQHVKVLVVRQVPNNPHYWAKIDLIP